jgi:NitT/TauT family transport system permease protein
MSPDASGKLLRGLLALAFWLAVWKLSAVLVGQELLVPAPGTVFARLWELMRTAVFWQTAGTSLGRVFLGFLGGVALGTVLAARTAASRVCDVLLSPAVRVVRATPVASFIVLLLLWMNRMRGFVPAVMAGLMVMPVLWGNVRKGIASRDGALLEVARVYGMNRFRTLRLVYLPAAQPYFVSGCVTSLGLAWKAGVAAEVLCQPKLAVGTQVYYSKIYLEPPSLFAWTIVVILLSYLVESLLVRLLRKGLGEAAAS